MDIERTARFIASFEGFRDRVYTDAGGVETIGYGETDGSIITQYRNARITEPEAVELLKRRVAGFAEEVDRLIAVSLNDEQHAALTSFAYNVGTGALAESTLRTRLNSGDYGSVPAELSRWVYGAGRRLEGLVARRRAEAELFAGGDAFGGGPEFLCQRGDCGPEVESIQRLLVEEHGYGIAVDGDFGPATEDAVRDFQTSHGLVVDGIVGAETWSALNARHPGPSRRSGEGDWLPVVAAVPRLLADHAPVDR